MLILLMGECDMLKCALCGHEVKERLIDHIVRKHKDIITLDEYKKLYGSVVTDEYRNKVSLKGKEKWRDPSYVKATMDSRQVFYNDPLHWEKVTNGIKNYYNNGGKVWNDGLTKADDERLVSIGKKNKEHLTGRTKETHENIRVHSERMKQLWTQENRPMTHNTKWMSEERLLEWRSKQSKISCEWFENNGYRQVYNGYVQGWYDRKNSIKEWYCSSYELDFMIFLDELGVEWTTKHNIRLKYMYDGVERNYIPDFKITIKNISYIFELKGWLKDKDKEKVNVGQQVYGDRYFIYFDVSKAKEKIYELIKG